MSRAQDSRNKQETTSQDTILLAESDPLVRQALRRTLESSGFSVLEATTGEGALDLCREHRGPIHILISDTTLPGLHGPELARRITSIRPLTRIVFLTAAPEETNSQAGVCPGCWLLVRKPFRPQELAHALAELLRCEFLPSGATDALTQAGLVE